MIPRRTFCGALAAPLLGGCAAAPRGPAMPDIVPVAAWGGKPLAATAPPQTITEVTLHHQGEIWEDGRDVVAYLRHLQQWSRDTKHWVDIPYHYVIAREGRIYAARPLGVPGDTNTEYDPRGHALPMLVGNFEEQFPTDAQLRSAVDLTAWLLHSHGLTVAQIGSHRGFSRQTVCPGAHFQALLDDGSFQRAVAARLRA
ncbi:MAG: N-acetylmuramoyl-L-alanine amidase [Roseateles depolymerans]|uniref:N-acetylmuramoyl-L-alanine amidase n=1 Tax=Roseateles depolymerans TaxID=76731 RepID=A0A2W5DWY1_9BURK|nr:MAG: N-acetylmuramoyl-L-alanine amidase [Roseateles depolymerans]